MTHSQQASKKFHPLRNFPLFAAIAATMALLMAGIAPAQDAQNSGKVVKAEKPATNQQLEPVEPARKIPRAYLGVIIQELTPDLARFLDFTGRHGVVVARVMEDSPAEKIGLVRGDVITHLNGIPLFDPWQLASSVAEADPGAEVAIEVIREGNEHQYTVVLGEKEMEAEGQASGEMRRDEFSRRPAPGSKVFREPDFWPDPWAGWGATPPPTPGLIDQEIQRMIDEALRGHPLYGRNLDLALPEADFAPHVDLKEENDRYIIEFDIPGAAAEGIEVDVTGRMLTVSGQREEKVEEKQDGQVVSVQHRISSFARSFALPGPVKAAGAGAKYEDGTLTVTLPKAEDFPTGSQRIEVK